MEFLIAFLGVRSLTLSKVGVVFLMLVCLGLIAIPVMLESTYLSSITIVSVIALLLLVRRFFNMK